MRCALSILDAYNEEVFDRRELMVLTGLDLPKLIDARPPARPMLVALPVELRLAALYAAN